MQRRSFAASAIGWSGRRHDCGLILYPVIGDVSVQSIDTAPVMKVIEPIWASKPEIIRYCPTRSPAAAAVYPGSSDDRARLHFGRSKRHRFAGPN